MTGMNNDHAALYTALCGTLRRYHDGWRWSDGTPAPEVEDLFLNQVAPNFRCVTYGSVTYVEIPHDWRQTRHWPNGSVDDEASEAIAALISEAGKASSIYAEGLAEAIDCHRLTKHGHLILITHWNSVMRDPCGATWRKDHEQEIVDKARSLGWDA